MLRVACSLIALAGCNAVFGLNEKAKLSDAGGDAPIFPDGELPTFRLRVLLADTEQPTAGALNVPTMIAPVGSAEFSDVEVGPSGGELVPATYLQATGEVEIPIANLTEAPWRVRYVFDGVRYELEWQPDLQNAKLALPAIGRLTVVPPPGDSGYNIQPTGTGTPPVAGYNKSRVFTTGAFTDVRTGTSPSSTTISDPANTRFGAPDSPSAAAGDVAVLVNYDTQAGCLRGNGYAAFSPPMLQAGTKLRITPDPAWVTTTAGTLTVSNQNQSVAPGLRLNAALGTRGVLMNQTAVEHGITINTSLPGIVVERPVTIGAATFPVPGPLMLMLAQCPLGTTAFPAFVKPQELDPFPRITQGIIVDQRSVGTTVLTSSVVGVDKLTGNTTTVDLRAPIAIAPIVLSSGADTFDLAGPSDGESVFFASSPATLSFALEADQGSLATQAHQFEVTLFAIENTGKLTKKRVWVSTKLAAVATVPHVIESPIPVDLSGLPSGKYVFQIRTIFGTPRAGLGDFETVEYPYSASSIFTRTFEF